MTGQVRHLLIADDHEVFRRGVRTILEARPALKVVAEASTGREALEEARVAKPDIAIIDYTLPELNVVDLTHALKREIPGVEVLMFALHDQEDLVLSALRAGVTGYMRKSDPSEHLLAGIDALSSHRPYLSCGVADELLAKALKSGDTDKRTLTYREREILQLVAEGNINKQIAHLLQISVKTVETHRSAIMHKLNYTNTAQLVRYALRNNIVAA